MKLFEPIRRHPRIAAATTALALGVGAMETVGYLQNRTHEVPAHACVSPIAASETYIDPNASLWLQTYTGFFTTGVVARGMLPEGAYGVQASFKSPDAGPETWDEHASRMIQAGDAGRFALKMAIGDGEVQFGVRVVAPEGSQLCDVPPDVAFTHEDTNGYFHASGRLPWPNPVNAPVNIFG